MGPTENLTGPRKRQAGGRRKQSGRRPRQRCCLLKGCEQRFHPRQAGQRYCSEDCRKAARKWSRWKAQQRYRETVAGKAKRNEQSRCYRQRAKTREASDPEAVKRGREGNHYRNIFFEHACDRPGCYERFAPERRSPLQRFCSQACRRALERVEERERRWKQARI